MKILILSYYYFPDLGPGALRAKSVVNELVNRKIPGLQIDVFTTLPNRYSSTKIFAETMEKNDSVTIHRFETPRKNDSLANQILSFLYFSKGVLKKSKNKKWDIIFCTSSKLFTASLGAILKNNNTKLYLDIRDLFPDALYEIYFKNPLLPFFPIIKWIEILTFKQADKVNLISPGFNTYFKKICPKLKPTNFTNGIDLDFFKIPKKNVIKKYPTILYAGNIGEGQGIHNLIPDVAKNLNNIKFLIIGDGGKKKMMLKNIQKKNPKNVKLISPLLRYQLKKYYFNSNILFLHLNDYQAFKKVLPSKIFEYAATGKPILAGVSGFAAKFIQKNIPGSYVFKPLDQKAMIKGVNHLMSGPKKFNRSKFIKKFLRKKIINNMVEDILKY